jgi:protein ImuB
MESFDPPPGIDGFTGARLAVPVFERLGEKQIDLLGGEDVATATELAELIERLRIRLGERATLQIKLLENHLPEKAWRGIPAVETNSNQLTSHGHKPPRPLSLFPPREIDVIVAPSDDREGRPVAFSIGRASHRILHAFGPERIAGIWWEGHHRTRDYFRAAADTGRHFWLFRVRENNRWFLHGEFI